MSRTGAPWEQPIEVAEENAELYRLPFFDPNDWMTFSGYTNNFGRSYSLMLNYKF